MKSPEQIAQATLNAHAIQPDWRRTGAQILPLFSEAVAADRSQRRAVPERIIVATSVGTLRTWVSGDTVADLLDTINGLLDCGYTAEELIIEGITQ